MKKLIEKHQQKNKGRGKITTVDTDSGRTMFFSYDTPTRNKLIQTTAGRSPYQEIPRDVVANNLQSIEQQRRILDELDRNQDLQNYMQYGDTYGYMLEENERRKLARQYEQAREEAETDTRWNPRTWVNTSSSVPLVGLPFTIAKALYSGANYLSGNEGKAQYWWNGANQDANMHNLAIAGAIANTNPVTGGIFDGALLGAYGKELDEQGKFQYPERLTGENKANLGMAVFPFFFPYIKNRNMLMAKAGDIGGSEIGGIESLSNEIVFPARGIDPVTRIKFKPILKSDLPEYLKMFNEGKYDLIPNGDGGFWKI